MDKELLEKDIPKMPDTDAFLVRLDGIVADSLEIDRDADYPVVDLQYLDNETIARIMQFTQNSFGKAIVYHGAQANELNHGEGASWHQALDPSRSRQVGRQGVYATTDLESGLVHATLEHRVRDMDPTLGETYGIRPVINETLGEGNIAASPAMMESVQRGDIGYTKGQLFILPAGQFRPIPGSNHEMIATEMVRPLLGFEVPASYGQQVAGPQNFSSNQRAA